MRLCERQRADRGSLSDGRLIRAHARMHENRKWCGAHQNGQRSQYKIDYIYIYCSQIHS